MLDEHKKQMDNLKAERDKNEKAYKEDAELKVREETQHLRSLIDL